MRRVSKISDTTYNSIIPTGWLTAYGRTFTDIPYSQAMFDELESIRAAAGSVDILEEMKDTKLAPHFEARHKLLDKLIKRTDTKQVLEVAAGLSTRGLDMSFDSSVDYVEVDLSAMMVDKRKILASLEQSGAVPKRKNLYLEDGNALDFDDLLKASRHFDEPKPIVVVNEGLLRYLSLIENSCLQIKIYN